MFYHIRKRLTNAWSQFKENKFGSVFSLLLRGLSSISFLGPVIQADVGFLLTGLAATLAWLNNLFKTRRESKNLSQSLPSYELLLDKLNLHQSTSSFNKADLENFSLKPFYISTLISGALEVTSTIIGTYFSPGVISAISNPDCILPGEEHPSQNAMYVAMFLGLLSLVVTMLTRYLVAHDIDEKRKETEAEIKKLISFQNTLHELTKQQDQVRQKNPDSTTVKLIEDLHNRHLEKMLQEIGYEKKPQATQHTIVTNIQASNQTASMSSQTPPNVPEPARLPSHSQSSSESQTVAPPSTPKTVAPGQSPVTQPRTNITPAAQASSSNISASAAPSPTLFQTPDNRTHPDQAPHAQEGWITVTKKKNKPAQGKRAWR